MLGKRILVVDDEDHICRVVALKLSGAGYRVSVAGDAEEACRVAAGERPDLIITDYQMPGPTGLELCERVSRWPGPAVPVVLLTARTFEVENDPQRPVNLKRIVAKPFSPRGLLQTVRELLEEAA